MWANMAFVSSAENDDMRASHWSAGTFNWIMYFMFLTLPGRLSGFSGSSRR